MVRLLRLQFPNALYHVTSREVRCENIYENDDDRLRFLEILGAQRRSRQRRFSARRPNRLCDISLEVIANSFTVNQQGLRNLCG
jgi:hypothetical protein